MSKLIALISPAKLLDDKTHYPELSCTQPIFIKEAEVLAQKLKKVSAKKLSELMDISAALGVENEMRYTAWRLPFTHANAHPALLMFKGDVYRGLKAETLSKKELNVAQEKLRILSGLYGLLRPLDFVMAYRLMMGTPFSPDAKTKNLYAFWGTKIGEQLKKEVDEKGVVVNLASTEYFKAVDQKALKRKVITCEFKELKGDKYSIVMTYAKQARGMMARFIVENNISNPKDLIAFDTERYAFNPRQSSESLLVFTRPLQLKGKQK